MPNLELNVGLKSIFALIQKLKQGIKQKSYIEISDADIGVSGRGLCVRIQTKNYKTKEYMYFQKTITEEEIITIDNPLYDSLYSNLINRIIEEANYFFREEQEEPRGRYKQNNANYCPCCDSFTCTCNAC
jgi:hypothetical protein